MGKARRLEVHSCEACEQEKVQSIECKRCTISSEILNHFADRNSRGSIQRLGATSKSERCFFDSLGEAIAFWLEPQKPVFSRVAVRSSRSER